MSRTAPGRHYCSAILEHYVVASGSEITTETVEHLNDMIIACWHFSLAHGQSTWFCAFTPRSFV